MAAKQVNSNLEQRQLIMWYIFFNTGIYVPQTITAVISDTVRFEFNLKIAKTYFLTFIDE